MKKEDKTMTKIKIVTTRPPIYDNACAAFKCDLSKMVFTYGDTIYNLSGQELPDHLIYHEQVHMEQQNHNDADAEIWWGKFLRDSNFRIDQEARAYGKQFQFICDIVKNPIRRNLIISDLGRFLSGPMYGNALPLRKAVNFIRHYSGIRR